MKCTVCGNEIDSSQNFCTFCGAPVPHDEVKVEPVIEPASFVEVKETAEVDAEVVKTEPEVVKTEPETEKTEPKTVKVEPVIPEEYKPISMWGYVGYQLLFGIPVIGWIILIILAFASEKNKNLTNFARANFVWLVFSILICAFAAGSGIAYLLLR